MSFDISNLKEIIKEYRNFPKEDILFRDVLCILQEPEIFRNLIKKMALSEIIQNADAILAIDARGFIFGSALSFYTSKPMVTVRKPGKLPGELISQRYELEYGKNTLSIQKESIMKYSKFAIVDDLLATRGTLKCVLDILEKMKKDLTGISVVVELVDLNGRKFLDKRIDSQLKI